jgi:transcriptional regulator with XRE-family HTH domain
LRARRTDAGLTLEQLADQIDFTPQYISEVERAKATPALAFVAAVDRALHADGALERLLPPVLQEREERRQERAEARRRTAAQSSLPCDAAHSEVAGDDEDVEPTDRRGLLGAAGAGALGLSVVHVAPATASEVDPELPAHWTRLLNLLSSHDNAFGPRAVLDAVRHELKIITAYRKVARGALRIELMRVEACWCEFGSWLAHDCGNVRGRGALLDRALHLAREADYADMIAWAHARQAQWADAPALALRYAEAGMRTPRAGAHTRALCATRVAYSHARLGNVAAVERSIADAERLASLESPPLPPPDPGMTDLFVGRWEARCWAALKPARAIGLYDAILRDQPRTWVREQGLYLAYVANACADAGELDRARAEGAKAWAIVKQTRSATAARELKRLQHALAAA